MFPLLFVWNRSIRRSSVTHRYNSCGGGGGGGNDVDDVWRCVCV